MPGRPLNGIANQPVRSPCIGAACGRPEVCPWTYMSELFAVAEANAFEVAAGASFVAREIYDQTVHPHPARAVQDRQPRASKKGGLEIRRHGSRSAVPGHACGGLRMIRATTCPMRSRRQSTRREGHRVRNVLPGGNCLSVLACPSRK